MFRDNIFSDIHLPYNGPIHTNLLPSSFFTFHSYYTNLLHILVTYPSHLQKDTKLAGVYSVYDKLSQVTGRLYRVSQEE